MKYYISDCHFGHLNVLRFDKRPFKNIDENDSELIRRWNERVTDEDDVYILGDFSWCGPTRTTHILQQLKGRKHLIRGNHDSRFLNREFSDRCRVLFTSIDDYLEVRDEIIDENTG